MSSLSPIKAIKRVATCSIQRSVIPALEGSNTVSKVDGPILHVPFKRQVSFGKIQIREFAPTIGDQPFVSHGVPIALGNTKVREYNDIPIDIYECARRPLRRQNSKELILKPKVRAAMYVKDSDKDIIPWHLHVSHTFRISLLYFFKNRLLSEGFQKKEINEAAIAAFEAKTSIQQSAQRKNWDQINERLENTTRILAKISRRPILRRSSSFSG
jgi:hypothetical protein